MWELLSVGCGGFVGAVARWSLSGWVQRLSGGDFPLGTYVANMVGCLFIGLVFALVEARPEWSPHVRLFLMVGLLGAFTTFSTFSHETLDLLQGGSWTLAVVNILGSVMVGLLAVVVGRYLGRLI
jgi:fluoride exporter